MGDILYCDVRTPPYLGCLLWMVHGSATEETSMPPPVCPQPVVLQRLSAGPWGAPSAPFAPHGLAQGDARWTAQ
jgi:hypothetical protein